MLASSPPVAERRPVDVLIVDDQAVFRAAARLVIDATPDFELVGEADSGRHALAAAAQLAPDLVLLDVRMDEMDGIETAQRLTVAHPDAVVVLLSIEEPPNLPAGVASCGAAELVRKRDFGPAVLRRVWGEHGSANQS
jgi:DNA-binding NarL/FixJ family response regulator